MTDVSIDQLPDQCWQLLEYLEGLQEKTVAEEDLRGDLKNRDVLKVCKSEGLIESYQHEKIDYDTGQVTPVSGIYYVLTNEGSILLAKYRLQRKNTNITSDKYTLLNPHKIDIVIFWNQDYALANIGTEKIQRISKDDLKPKPWNRLAEFAHESGRVDPPNPYRLFEEWIEDYEKMRGNPPNQREIEQTSKKFNKEQEAWIRITKRLRTELKNILNLSTSPIPKEKNGPYKSLFKSITIKYSASN